MNVFIINVKIFYYLFNFDDIEIRGRIYYLFVLRNLGYRKEDIRRIII